MQVLNEAETNHANFAEQFLALGKEAITPIKEPNEESTVIDDGGDYLY